MKNHTIRILVLIGSITIAGLAGVQFYLLKTAFNNRQKVFEHSVQVALMQVVNRLNNHDIKQFPQTSPVIKLSNDYYVVDVNRDFECEILEFFLISEFERAGINFDFEYAIYDCHSDAMIYGSHVTFKENRFNSIIPIEFPKHNGLVYYFAIRFPNIQADILGSFRVWFVFALIFIGVLAFFIYAIWIILSQKRLSELQRNFVSTMTHEFRTPLSANHIAIEFLQEQEVIKNDVKIKKYIGLLSLQNTRLNNLIERLLHMSKSENATIELNYTSLDLTELLNDIISVHTSKNTNAQINLTYTHERINICSDKFHVGNILHVIIDNAIKYSQPKPVINIFCELKGKYIKISIADNGPGIPKKFRKRIFLHFYRIPTGNIHNVKGFGIGLYYVKLLVKKMKWKIGVDDNIESGTRFTLNIPLSKKRCK